MAGIGRHLHNESLALKTVSDRLLVLQCRHSLAGRGQQVGHGGITLSAQRQRGLGNRPDRGPADLARIGQANRRPELAGDGNSARADLASLGYILIEMLAGQCPFEGLTTYEELLTAKQRLDQRLPQLLPQEVSGNELLLNLCQRLTAPDPERRFPSAEAADLDRKGAADFHRQLVKGDLASEYENDIRVWLESLE